MKPQRTQPKVRTQRQAARPPVYPPALVGLQPSRMLPGEVGLFALRSLPAGAIIADAGGWDESVLIPWADFRQLDPITRRRLKMFCWQSEAGIHAPQDINRLTIPWHINHSCVPNTAIDEDGNYRTTRKVARNEELTLDAGTLMTCPRFRMQCRCGLPECIGTIRAKPSVPVPSKSMKNSRP